MLAAYGVFCKQKRLLHTKRVWKALSAPAHNGSRLVARSSAGVILSGERSSGYAPLVRACIGAQFAQALIEPETGDMSP